MRHVDLCSGIGGFALGFEWVGLSKPILFCDIEPWSRQILRKHWPDVPIAEDVKELANDPDGLIPDCDILTAGYPCQPFSLAGERRGTEDDRHIWPYILSIVQAKRPSWCVFENVYGHVSMGLDEVLSDLEGEGYAARPFIVPACAADAPHRRDRVWIIARNVGDTKNERHDSGSNTQRKRSTHQQEQRLGVWSKPSRPSENVAHTDSAQQQGRWISSRIHKEHTKPNSGSDPSRQQATQFWLAEPAVGRVAHGIPRRVDRLKGLGNAIVPQIAMRIGETIKQCETKP
jgi:DNA (cytosine-5)-methyltransferase 1